MALFNNSFSRTYHHLFTELADKRTNHWPLISDPVPGLTILILYLYFSLKWGPRYMEDKKPFQMQKTLIIYNFIQVLVSCFLFYEGLDAGWLTSYSWKCQPVDPTYSPEAMRVARGVYIYFLAKISELLDTIFFVIRKKDRQVTFLHLYHHTVMPMISWGATKYFPGGHGTLIGVINSFVHIIMYTYYMFSALGPKYQKYLFWKKYITTLQMLQFCIAFLHSSQLLFYDCGYPRWSVVFTLPNSIFFYYLFYDFYYKAYGKPGDRKAKTEDNLTNGNANGNLNGNSNSKANGNANGNLGTNVVSNGKVTNKKDE